MRIKGGANARWRRRFTDDKTTKNYLYPSMVRIADPRLYLGRLFAIHAFSIKRDWAIDSCSTSNSVGDADPLGLYNFPPPADPA